MILETTTYLGPARVVRVESTGVRLALSGQETAATLALSSPYRPAEGDVVLAIGQEDKYYVLGIIVGSGKTVFATPGDVEFRTRGKMDFVAGEGMRFSSPRVEIRAGRLEVLAKAVLERFGDVWRRIRGVFQSRSGRVREVVEGSYALKAGRIVERADGNVQIDGKEIKLG